MRTSTYFAIFFVIGFLAGLAVSYLSPPKGLTPSITGEVISDRLLDYTYTTAICNDDNECIDVLVECTDGEVTSLAPTSDLIALGEDWEDFRDAKENFCK